MVKQSVWLPVQRVSPSFTSCNWAGFRPKNCSIIWAALAVVTTVASGWRSNSSINVAA